MVKRQSSKLKLRVRFSYPAPLLFLLLSACADVQPTVQKMTESDYRVVGKLHKLEYDEIATIVDHHQGQRINFYVSSKGGNSEDLFLAMDSVYRHGNVHWYTLNECDSACAIMALATKHAHGEIRIHSFYSHRGHKVIPAPEYNEVVLNKLHSYGYETENFSYMFNSVEELWPMTLDDGKISK